MGTAQNSATFLEEKMKSHLGADSQQRAVGGETRNALLFKYSSEGGLVKLIC